MRLPGTLLQGEQGQLKSKRRSETAVPVALPAGSRWRRRFARMAGTWDLSRSLLISYGVRVEAVTVADADGVAGGGLQERDCPSPIGCAWRLAIDWMPACGRLTKPGDSAGGYDRSADCQSVRLAPGVRCAPADWVRHGRSGHGRHAGMWRWPRRGRARAASAAFACSLTCPGNAYAAAGHSLVSQSSKGPLMSARTGPPVRSIGTDPAAFTEFYRAHVDEVTRFVARRVADPQLAADLTAEVFLAVIDAAARYRDPSVARDVAVRDRAQRHRRRVPPVRTRTPRREPGRGPPAAGRRRR